MNFIFPGSFDPPTVGHLDIIERMSNMADRLYIAVMINTKKKYMYTREQRVEMLQTMASPFPNTEVVCFDGLLVDAAEKLGADAIVRGIRNSADYQYESEMAQANLTISGIETFYIQANPSCSMVSSSLVRELLTFGGDVAGFVPESIIELL